MVFNKFCCLKCNANWTKYDPRCIIWAERSSIGTVVQISKLDMLIAGHHQTNDLSGSSVRSLTDCHWHWLQQLEHCKLFTATNSLTLTLKNVGQLTSCSRVGMVLNQLLSRRSFGILIGQLKFPWKQEKIKDTEQQVKQNPTVVKLILVKWKQSED